MRRLIPLLLACAVLVSAAGFCARSSGDGFVWREVVVLVAEQAHAPAEAQSASSASEEASPAPPAVRASHSYRSLWLAVARLYIQHCSLLC
jgi:hypothetical protein